MNPDRIWLIDALRGAAVIGMVVYHLAFGLFFFGNIPLPIHHWSWELLQALVAGKFLFLVGMSLSVSYLRRKSRGEESRDIFRDFTMRAAKILILALVITLTTWFFLPEYFVRFGVLHLIAVSIVLAWPFLSRPWLAGGVGLLLLLFSAAVHPLPTGNLSTLWLGFAPLGFRTLDYFPVIPWFGVVLMGLASASCLKFSPGVDKLPWLTWIGRHSLIIYFLHQPLLLIFVFLIRILVQ